MIRISYQPRAPLGARVAALVIWLPQDAQVPTLLESGLKKRVRQALAQQDFAGKAKEVTILLPEGAGPRIVLVGLGKREDLTRETVRRAAGLAGKQLRSMPVNAAAALIPELTDARRSDLKAGLGEVIAEGFGLGAYAFEAYKRAIPEAEGRPHLTSVTIFDPGRVTSAASVETGAIRAAAICLARDLGNHPSNDMTPNILAQRARAVARRRNLKCKILGRPDLERLGMGMLLGVTKGSAEPPHLILLEYRPKGALRTLCFVGKGITFDTGGISIKPAAQMDEMKFDMCGGAAVLGALDAIAALGLPVNVIGVIPACENMPGGKALKPGDILKSYGGQTVEVLNTDAEGRLILGDALAYAIERYKPDAVVDLATLTGACVIALGHYASGAISNDATLQEQVVQAGARAGDSVWPLPNFPEYEEALRGRTGDLQNIGPREGGAITAGLFLKQFVSTTPWVHLDIAGTAWGVTNLGHIPNDGATGVGVALLVDLASRA